MTNRITWEGVASSQTGYILGEARGYKAKIRVFEISYTSDRADIRVGTPYLLAHRLPFRGVERKFTTVKIAQEHAERYLVWAFELMGFMPREELEAAQVLAESRREDAEHLSRLLDAGVDNWEGYVG